MKLNSLSQGSAGTLALWATPGRGQRKGTWRAAAFALCAGAFVLWSGPVSALCSPSQRSVFFVEFAQGDAALAPEVEQRFMSYMLPQLAGNRYVESYYVLGSGDIAEGEEWDKSSTEARHADQRLARERIEAIRTMIRAQVRDIRSAPIEVKMRENRQVLSEAEQAASPEITGQVRAGVVATIRQKAPAVPANEPVPTC